jgi:hypothetical protein
MTAHRQGGFDEVQRSRAALCDNNGRKRAIKAGAIGNPSGAPL